MLPKANRLKKKKDFERVFKTGKGFKDNFLFLKLARNNLKIIRFGFVVGKNFSKKAASRNRIKRRLRGLVKNKLSETKPGFDVVLVVAKGLGIKDFRELAETINKLFKKAKLL